MRVINLMTEWESGSWQRGINQMKDKNSISGEAVHFRSTERPKRPRDQIEIEPDTFITAVLRLVTPEFTFLGNYEKSIKKLKSGETNVNSVQIVHMLDYDPKQAFLI